MPEGNDVRAASHAFAVAEIVASGEGFEGAVSGEHGPAFAVGDFRLAVPDEAMLKEPEEEEEADEERGDEECQRQEARETGELFPSFVVRSC